MKMALTHQQLAATTSTVRPCSVGVCQAYINVAAHPGKPCRPVCRGEVGCLLPVGCLRPKSVAWHGDVTNLLEVARGASKAVAAAGLEADHASNAPMPRPSYHPINSPFLSWKGKFVTRVVN